MMSMATDHGWLAGATRTLACSRLPVPSHAADVG
jgi:hypothetical protein